jgi:hypothetical protein
VAEALRGDKDLTIYSESAPDPRLYAILRALDQPSLADAGQRSLPAEETEVIGHLVEHVRDASAGKESIEDSSNVWWGLRRGLEVQRPEFLPLLHGVVERFAEAKSPSASVADRSPIPDIYHEIRTKGYTLSNIQAILEPREGRSSDDLSQSVKNRLHEIVQRIIGDLLAAGESKHIYLAAVSYEAMRNYIDYLKDHELMPRLDPPPAKIKKKRRSKRG